jgi:protocatechuate 3,4-dioxygenase alpha subunit
MLKQTPSQTVGPYFAYGLTPEQYLYDYKSLAENDLVTSDEEHIVIRGRVFDGEENVIPDAMLEIWDNQNNLFGRFGTGTEKDKSFVFKTKKPLSMEGNAPFLSVILFMRGQLIHSYTRIYFSDEVKNATDEVLSRMGAWSATEGHIYSVLEVILGTKNQVTPKNMSLSSILKSL